MCKQTSSKLENATQQTRAPYLPSRRSHMPAPRQAENLQLKLLKDGLVGMEWCGETPEVEF